MKTRLLILLLLVRVRADAEGPLAPLSDDPSVAAHVLNTARKDIKEARYDFKDMSPDERGVVQDARRTIMRTADWRALVPALGAAADLLEGAGALEGPAAGLCAHMAKTYRALAHDVDAHETYLTPDLRKLTPGERAAATFAEAEKLLAARDKVAVDEDAKQAWGVVRRTDPRWRAFALNFATLARGYATFADKEHEEKLAALVANAEKLHKALEPYFKGVRTKRGEDEQEPEPEPPPEKPRLREIRRIG